MFLNYCSLFWLGARFIYLGLSSNNFCIGIFDYIKGFPTEKKGDKKANERWGAHPPPPSLGLWRTQSSSSYPAYHLRNTDMQIQIQIQMQIQIEAEIKVQMKDEKLYSCDRLNHQVLVMFIFFLRAVMRTLKLYSFNPILTKSGSLTAINFSPSSK